MNGDNYEKAMNAFLHKKIRVSWKCHKVDFITLKKSTNEFRD